jgi:hypothetical protein
MEIAWRCGAQLLERPPPSQLARVGVAAPAVSEHERGLDLSGEPVCLFGRLRLRQGEVGTAFSNRGDTPVLGGGIHNVISRAGLGECDLRYGHGLALWTLTPWAAQRPGAASARRWRSSSNPSEPGGAAASEREAWSAIASAR